MAHAAAEEKAVNAEFINRSLASRGTLNMYKGAWFGSVIALSQAAGALPCARARGAACARRASVRRARACALARSARVGGGAARPLCLPD